MSFNVGQAVRVLQKDASLSRQVNLAIHAIDKERWCARATALAFLAAGHHRVSERY
jgi:hypothetical protein